MSNQLRRYEPLTSANAALVLVDHQVGLMTGVRDISTGELKHNVVGLAKAAKLHNLPIIVTTTARDSMWGPTFPELVDALPGIEIIDRATVNAFDDERVSRAIDATGRKKLIFAGISLEICAAFPAITPRDAVKRVEGNRLVESLDRSLVVLAQTPQGFAYELLARAHREAADAGLVGDDDAQLVAATGHVVTVVPGEPANIKLTTPEDLEVVEALIREHETAAR